MKISFSILLVSLLISGSSALATEGPPDCPDKLLAANPNDAEAFANWLIKGLRAYSGQDPSTAFPGVI